MSAETQPQQVQKPSKQQWHADGLPSESESSDLSPTGNNYEPAPSTLTQPEPDTTPLMLQLPALDQSQSTASLTSQVTAAVGSLRTEDEKHAKFDECYQTAMLSDEEVLHKFPSSPGPQFIFFWYCWGEADGPVDIWCLPTLPDSPNHHSQERHHCVCLCISTSIC